MISAIAMLILSHNAGILKYPYDSKSKLPLFQGVYIQRERERVILYIYMVAANGNLRITHSW